jgi:hypothetical protein
MDVESIPEQFADELARFDELLALAETLVADGARLAGNDPVKVVAMLFVSRAINALHGVRALFVAGLEGEAIGATRTLCELTVDLGYIMAGAAES